MKNHTNENQNPDVQKLGDLIKDIRIAMMATVDPDGSVRSRPMASQEIEFDGDLWFLTGRSSGKIHSIENNQKINLSYADPGHSRYVSVFGHAEIVDDKEKAKELWNPIYKAWFPKGLEDPELILLKIHVEGAEYWDSPSGKFVQLIGFAKALATGEPYKGGKGEHEKIQIHH